MMKRGKLSNTLLALALASCCASIFAPGCASAPTAAPATPAAAPPTTAQAGATTVVAVAPPAQPCCPHETLWEFLGVKHLLGCVAGLLNNLRNRLGSIFPGLEATPALLAITDPSNANSSNPAVAAAAGAKADEDAAPQKIKAIRYLATLGCAGCYPGIQDALLDSLDDCTEEVRYEAAKALRELSGAPCSTCKTKSCCSPKVLKKLDEVVNKKEKGCYKESSARVRREARLAMQGCGGAPPATPDEGPKEGPSEGPPGAAPAADKTASESDGALKTARAASASGRASSPSYGVAAADSDCGCNRGASTLVIRTSPAAPQTAAKSPSPTIAAPTPTKDDAPAARTASPAPVSIIRTSGAVLAEVNGELIFESAVTAAVDRRFAADGELSIEEKFRRRPAYFKQELSRAIDRKLLCQEARRAAPEIVQAAFDASPDEASVATAWLRAQTPRDDAVTREQMLVYYRANLGKYQRPMAVRYEQVIARDAQFTSREEAQFAINYIRNRALGVPQAVVAANRLQAVEVRTADWTEPSTVSSAQLAQALAALPVGAVSQAFEEDGLWRVVRVLERRPAGPAPIELFAEPIRQDILQTRHQYREEAYLRQLRSRAHVWTAFDPPEARAQLQAVRPAGE